MKPTILLSRSIQDVPFDVSSQRIILYGEEYESARPVLEETIKTVLSSGHFEEAQRLIGSGLYRGAIAILSIVLEQHLRQMVLEVDLTAYRTSMGLNQMVQYLSSRGLISQEDAADLRDVLRLRNKAVHDVLEPNVDEAQLVLSSVGKFVDKYPLKS